MKRLYNRVASDSLGHAWPINHEAAAARRKAENFREAMALWVEENPLHSKEEYVEASAAILEEFG